jgi:hypothetical protein
MRPDPLLPNQPDLEHELAARTCPEPPAGLRDRILATVSAQRRPTTQGSPRRRWHVLWQAAAAVVLALNLAMSAVNGCRYESLHPRVAEPGGFTLGRPIPVLTQPGAPAPTDGEDRFQAFAASALAQLTPAPDAGPVSRRFFEQEEN